MKETSPSGDDRGDQGPRLDEVLSSSRGKKAGPPSSAPSPPEGGKVRPEDVVFHDVTRSGASSSPGRKNRRQSPSPLDGSVVLQAPPALDRRV